MARYLLLLTVLFSMVVYADQGKSLKEVLKLNKENILSPKDLGNKYQPPKKEDFPVSWKDVHVGLFNMEVTYTYNYDHFENNKTFITMTSSVDDAKISLYIENGNEYTDRGYGYKMNAHQSCLLVIGECKYGYLGKSKTAKTKFKSGVWITIIDGAKIESVYEKNGLLLYRRHIGDNGSESTTYRTVVVK